MVESIQQSSAAPKHQDVGRGSRNIIQPYLAVHVSIAFGTVSSLYPILFLYLFYSSREHLYNTQATSGGNQSMTDDTATISIHAYTLYMYSHLIQIKKVQCICSSVLLYSCSDGVLTSRYLAGTVCRQRRTESPRSVTQWLCYLSHADEV